MLLDKSADRRTTSSLRDQQPDERLGDVAKAPAAAPISSPAHQPGQVSNGPLVGQVMDTEHPTLRGRVLVRMATPSGDTDERWLPTLQGLAVRELDRVLVTQPTNWPEPVVTGVIDGFARRPEIRRDSKAALELLGDESVRVLSHDGSELVEVFQGEEGPVVRLLQADVNLELEGRLRISAKSLLFEARVGEARIEAKEDVVLRGEGVRLN